MSEENKINRADQPDENKNSSLDWCNQMQERPVGEWAYYRNGEITGISENEARATFDQWRIFSCEKGAATFMIDQLWDEIDKLRSKLEQYKSKVSS